MRQAHEQIVDLCDALVKDAAWQEIPQHNAFEQSVFWEDPATEAVYGLSGYGTRILSILRPTPRRANRFSLTVVAPEDPSSSSPIYTAKRYGIGRYWPDHNVASATTDIPEAVESPAERLELLRTMDIYPKGNELTVWDEQAVAQMLNIGKTAGALTVEQFLTNNRV